MAAKILLWNAVDKRLPPVSSAFGPGCSAQRDSESGFAESSATVARQNNYIIPLILIVNSLKRKMCEDLN